MRRFLTRLLRILAQFVVAGGFTQAVDAWVVSLVPAWQLTVLAVSQLTIAASQFYLDEYRHLRAAGRQPQRSTRAQRL
jgi:hypothetical protein